MSRPFGAIIFALLLICPAVAFALGSPVENCSHPKSGLELLDRHPELSEACEAIIQVNGHRYVQMGASLQQHHDAFLVLRLNGSTHDLALSRRADDRGPAAADDWSKALPVGSALSLYVPEDRLLEVFAEAGPLGDAEITVVVESVEPTESRIADYTCCPRRRPWYPIADILPKTGGPLPIMGLAGAVLLLKATELRPTA